VRTNIAPPSMVANAIVEYHLGIAEAVDLLGLRSRRTPGFQPGYELPELDGDIADFYSASGLSVAELDPYQGRTLKLLNLMHNPRTRTTKTIASLVIVARAMEHIRRTGERVLILTPTSANKGTALMDAVLRAHERSLVSVDQLQVCAVVPRQSLPKVWRSALTEDPHFRALNPVLSYGGENPEQVKVLARAFVDDWGARIKRRAGVNVWYSMDLDNYRVADSVRAYFEQDAFPPEPGLVRFHAHAVSSAFGLLGYDLGRQVLAQRGAATGKLPRFFLVQHLRTPDMILSMRFGTFSRSRVPAYTFDPRTGLYVQDEDPGFPLATNDPQESIDPTFYTREPATSVTIDRIIAQRGGGGIVVSRRECLGRYEEIRASLARVAVDLPSEPERLREWALVMAFTGVLMGIDRDLIPEGADVVVHGSGSFGIDDFEPIDPSVATPVLSPADMADPLLRAVSGQAL
jgi:hypothetical protein